jgi:anti-anti-sigma regulatory factor
MAGRRAVKRQGSNTASGPERPVTQAEAVVLLPADCRMASQAALKEALLRAADAQAVVLNGGEVERIDTAFLQLLMLFRRELEMRGGSLKWQGASEVLVEGAGLLGLTRILDLPATALA